MLKEHFLKLSKIKKRVFAGAMATALVSTSINIGTFVAEAGNSKNGSVITAFEELPEEIAYQYLPIGSEEYDIEFPTELNVTIYSNEDTEGTEKENEGAFEERNTRQESGEDSNDEEGEEATRETRESEEDQGDRREDDESDNGDSGNREDEDNEPVNDGSLGGNEEEGNNGSEDIRDNDSNNEDAAQPNEGGENSENNNNESNDNGTDTDTAVNNTVDTTTASESVPEGGEPEDDTLISQTVGLTASPGGGSLVTAYSTMASAFKAFPLWEQNAPVEHFEARFDALSASVPVWWSEGPDEGITSLLGPVTVYAAEPEEDDENNEDDAADSDEDEGINEDGADEGNDNNELRELSAGEEKTLKNITWSLIGDESTYSRFQAVRAGDVFVFEPLLRQYGLKSDVELPKIRVTITEEDGSYEEREEATEEAAEEAVEEATEEAEETVSENEAEETEEETVSENEAEEKEETVSENEAEEESVSENEAEPEAFDQMMIVGGVRVRVEAPEGVFPAGSTLKVVRLGDSDEETAKRVISSADTNAAGNTDAENTENTGNVNSMDIMLFDVTILDKDGNEIQPDTGIGVPRITFENAEIIDKSVDGENTNEDSGLTVYHFDDGFSGAEKLETEVNKGEKSVSAPAEHFSTYGLTAVANYTQTKTSDDYIIEMSDDCNVNNNSTSRYVDIEPSSDVDIKISMKNQSSTANQRIFIFPTSDINSISVELNNIKYNYFGGADTESIVCINDYVKNLVVTLNNTSLESSTAGLEYVDNNDVTLLLKGNNSLKVNSSAYHGGIYADAATKTPRVTIKGSGSVNDKLNITANGSSKAIFGDVSIESGFVNVTSGPQYSGGTGDILTISGGTHSFPYSFIDNTPANNTNIKITGGSVNFNITDAAKGTQTFSNGVHKLYVINLNASNANKKITRLFGEDNATLSYGTNDMYTNNAGKAFIWLPESVNIIGVEADGKLFALGSTAETATKLKPYSDNKYINTLTQYGPGNNIVVKYDGSETIAEWYSGKVNITASGYQVSDSSNGPFNDSYTWTGNGKNVTKTLYFKYVGDPSKIYYGIVSQKTVGPVNFSTGKPTGTIKVIKKSSSKIQTKAKTMGYTNEADKVTITADKNSTVAGINKTEYYFTDKFYGDENAIKKAASGNWTEYNEGSKPALIENKLNYCYAQFTDNAGNAGYVSSQGVWYDTKDPKAKSAKATPEDTKATVEVKGEDKESGIAYYYVLAKKKTDSKPTKDNVKSSGKKAEDGNVEVTGLTAETSYKFYCVIEDKCGNLSDIKECSTTTKEPKKDEKKAAADAAAEAAKKAAAAAAAAKSDKLGESNSKKHGVGDSGEKADGSEEADSDDKKETEIKSRIPYIEDATEGIQIGKENTSGWDKIEEETGKAEAPAEIHIDMNGSSVVPATALNSIEGRDVTCFFGMGDDVIWAVNGMSISDKVPDDIDFKVKTDTKNIPSKLVNEVADVYPHKNLSIAYDGEFGFTAIMCLNVGEENAGMYANRYYYNEEEGALEFIDSEDVDGNGNTEFEFTHASDYTIVIRGDALTEKSAAALVNTSDDGSDLVVSEAADPPKKGNNHWWLLLITILSLILCGVILFMPEKKEQQG